MANQPEIRARGELLRRYRHYSSEAQRHAALGLLTEALANFDAAIEAARSLGEQERVDRAIVNRIGFMVEKGATQREILELSGLLLRTTSPEVRFLAAYNLSWVYRGRHETDRAISYANRALRFATELQNDPWRASALNLLGLSYISGSYFDKATECFAQGLGLLADRRERRCASLLDNYGYCLVVQGRHKEGFRALLESLRTLRRLGEKWMETAPLLSLTFAYLEIGKVRAARRHGRTALKLAEEMGDTNSIKVALYLLGEVAKQAADEFSARRYFARLQEAYYPTAPDLIDLLLVVDARTMVNLKA